MNTAAAAAVAQINAYELEMESLCMSGARAAKRTALQAKIDALWTTPGINEAFEASWQQPSKAWW